MVHTAFSLLISHSRPPGDSWSDRSGCGSRRSQVKQKSHKYPDTAESATASTHAFNIFEALEHICLRSLKWNDFSEERNTIILVLLSRMCFILDAPHSTNFTQPMFSSGNTSPSCQRNSASFCFLRRREVFAKPHGSRNDLLVMSQRGAPDSHPSETTSWLVSVPFQTCRRSNKSTSCCRILK